MIDVEVLCFVNVIDSNFVVNMRLFEVIYNSVWCFGEYGF